MIVINLFHFSLLSCFKSLGVYWYISIPFYLSHCYYNNFNHKSSQVLFNILYIKISETIIYYNKTFWKEIYFHLHSCFLWSFSSIHVLCAVKGGRHSEDQYLFVRGSRIFFEAFFFFLLNMWCFYLCSQRKPRVTASCFLE